MGEKDAAVVGDYICLCWLDAQVKIKFPPNLPSSCRSVVLVAEGLQAKGLYFEQIF